MTTEKKEETTSNVSVKRNFCQSTACKASIAFWLVLMTIYFIYDMYGNVVFGLVQANQQYGYNMGQEALIGQLFTELEKNKCQPIPVNLNGKSTQILEASCVSSVQQNTAPQNTQVNPQPMQAQPTQGQLPSTAGAPKNK